MYNGIINVYKEAGFTSFDVVAKLRGICGQKKIGHTGTLDPDATGVLPICLGSGTKVVSVLTDSDKVYLADMILGVSTDTLDMSGTVLKTAEVNVNEEQVVAAINSFKGEIMQVPPMYSALKVNGKKLVDLAREGITIERQARPVTIYDIEIVSINLPKVQIRVSCSKGTYIRTLCSDIGDMLGCGGALERLVRERAAGFDISESLSLSDLQALKSEGRLGEAVLSVESMFTDYRIIRMANTDADRILYNGNKLEDYDISDPFVPDDQEILRVYDSNGIFKALYKYAADTKLFKPEKMFL